MDTDAIRPFTEDFPDDDARLESLEGQMYPTYAVGIHCRTCEEMVGPPHAPHSVL